MILSTSDKLRYKKAGIVYILITVFCGIFRWIYERFSHGVTSDAMIFLFLYPLIGGWLPLMMLRLSQFAYPKRLEFNLYQSGIAVLTIGSCLKGIFEIYGTSSEYVIVYQWTGGIFLTSAVLIGGIRELKNEQLL